MYEELKGKVLLLLGGNLEKEDIRKFADINQITLIAVGNNPNADYCKIADEYYDINSTDGPEMINFINAHHVDGVFMGGNEQVIGSATEYLNELGLPCYCTNDQWNMIQNKGNFKKLCQKAGLPVAERFLSVQCVSENDYPVITKPIDGAGSEGFSVCRNREELQAGYEKAKEASFDGDVLIEKFLPNKSVVVIYTFSDGKMYYSGMENKIPVHYEKQGSFVAGIHLFESKCANEFRELFEEKLKSMFLSIGIKEGTVWMEVFHKNGEYYFNEAGYRYSGSSTPYPIDYLHGINQVYSDLLFSLTGRSNLYGNPPLVSEDIERGKHYCILPVHMKPGTVCSIEGIDAIEEFKECVKVIRKKNVGSIVKDTGSVDQVFCFIHFIFGSEVELRNTIRGIYQELKAFDQNGENLIHNMLSLESADINVEG